MAALLNVRNTAGITLLLRGGFAAPQLTPTGRLKDFGRA